MRQIPWLVGYFVANHFPSSQEGHLLRKTFINSLPKSGTNLLAKCLLLFGYTEKGHLSAGTVLDSRPSAIFKRLFWRTRGQGYSLGVNSPIEVRRSPVDSMLRRVRDNQFISGHVGYRNDLLETIVSLDFKPIQVIRDPRAVLASFVPYVLGDKNHFLHSAFKSLPNNDRYKAVLDGIVEGGLTQRPLRICCLALDPWVDNPAVLTIRYEDIVGSKGGGSDVRRLEILEDIASALNIENPNIQKVSDELYGPGRHTFRKGRVGGWDEEIPAMVLKRVNSELEDVLEKWGYAQ